MGIKEIYRNVVLGSSAAGVEIFFKGEEEINATLVVVKQSKGILDITEKKSDINSFESLFNELNSNTPIYLSIDGKGIIHKQVKISETEELDLPRLASQHFPNFSEEDFIIQKKEIDRNLIFLSLIRRETMEIILQKFESKNLFVFNTVLGPFALNGISGLLNLYNEITLNNHKLSLSSGVVSSIKKSEHKNHTEDYKIDNETVNGAFLNPYACSIAHFIAGNNEVKFLNLPASAQEFIYKKVYKLAGLSAIALFFTILLLNFFLFSYYGSKHQEVDIAFKQYVKLKGELSKLEDDFKGKYSFLNEKMFLKGSRVSFYSDQIVKDMPTSILLNELSTHPLEKVFNVKNEITFFQNTIIIEGTTTSTQDLNSWINQLKKKDWVNNLTLVNLTQEEKKDFTFFRLEVTHK